MTPHPSPHSLPPSSWCAFFHLLIFGGPPWTREEACLRFTCSIKGLKKGFEEAYVAERGGGLGLWQKQALDTVRNRESYRGRRRKRLFPLLLLSSNRCWGRWRWISRKWAKKKWDNALEVGEDGHDEIKIKAPRQQGEENLTQGLWEVLGVVSET